MRCLQELRQRLSDTEVLLQQEKQEHGVTRAEQASIEVALQRKSVSLQNSEAEKSRLATRLEHAEETVRELTHAKLESTTQDATARKAQHASEVSNLPHCSLQILKSSAGFLRSVFCAGISSSCTGSNISAESAAAITD